MKIFVTGYGVISAIGFGAEESISSLKAMQTGIKEGASEETSAFKLGAIGGSNDELSSQYHLKTKGSRTALLGMIAAKQAFENHTLIDGLRTGLISGTSVGGMDTTEVEYKKYLEDGSHDIQQYRHHSSGTSTQEIAQELGITDFINTISTACSSSVNSIMMGARMIKNGLLDRVIVGGTDGLALFTMNGFKSLMINDPEWCRPFDESREGINLGEGAGYLVLESEKSLEQTKMKPIVELKGYSNASDAHHQTASSPEGYGAQLSMNEALKMAGLEPKDIDYINAHGTGTPNNDSSESHALIEIFKDDLPPFSSTKSYTGHTLAASGGIEAVFSILAIQHGFLMPNLNFKVPIQETGLIPQLKFEEGKTIKNVLSNSFGFGGNNSTMIFGEIS